MSTTEKIDVMPPWMKDEDEELDSISEQERTWRDPSAHKMRLSTSKWLRGEMARRGIIRVSINLIDDPFVRTLTNLCS